jgi:hypothetical protein
MVGLESVLRYVRETRRHAARIAVAIVVMAVSLGCSLYWGRERHLMLLKEYQQPYVAVCAWAKKNMPPDALVACMQTSSAFYFYTDYPILRWDFITPDNFSILHAALRESKRPFYAVLFPFEQEDALRRMPIAWKKVAEVKGVGIWKFEPAQSPP